MKPRIYSNSRLYITEDMHRDNVWFARTDIEQIARFKMNDGWEMFFYPYKVSYRLKTLEETLRLIEKLFKEYWREKYAERI